MVFKLIRTDTPDPKKIELPVGTHLIGRGNLLGCDDKRVSRQHGELEVTEDSVSIKSLHQNPCFYIRRSTKRSIVLKQNCTINLSHGDKFGLLPSTLWYELIDLEIKAKDSGLFPGAGDNNCNNSLEQTVDSTITIGSVAQTVNKSLQSSENETVVDNETANRAGILLKNQSNQDKPCTSSLENFEAKTIKRSHSITADNSNTFEIKKVKTELGDTKDVKPGPSNDQAASCGQGNAVPPSPVTPFVRERCFYGGYCFRRNAQHKARFSHPRDSDWGTEERGVCPTGRACIRRDPRHWRDYTHPEGVLPPTQPPQSGVIESQQRNTESNEEQNDSQEDHPDSEEDKSDDEADNSNNEEDNSDDEEDKTDSEAYFDTDD